MLLDRCVNAGRFCAIWLALVAVVVSLPAGAQNIPDAQALTRVVKEAHERFKDIKEGANADYIPELAKVPSELFGVAIITAKGEVYTAGDVDYPFSIQSVS